MRKTGKKLALILTMAITLTLFTSCGGKKSDVGGLGDDNKVNNIFNQGKNKDTDNNSMVVMTIMMIAMMIIMIKIVMIVVRMTNQMIRRVIKRAAVRIIKAHYNLRLIKEMAFQY